MLEEKGFVHWDRKRRKAWKEFREFGRKVLSLRRSLLDLVSGAELGQS